jgi:hypothetical protein
MKKKERHAMNKLKKLGFKKVPGTAPGFHMYELTPAELGARQRIHDNLKAEAASHKRQAASNKHLTNLNNVLYRIHESKRFR